MDVRQNGSNSQAPIGIRIFLRLLGALAPEREKVTATITRIPTAQSSAFAWNDDKGNWYLIDAGASKDAREILAFLAESGSNGDDVKMVFLTHAHMDHIAGLPQFPNATIYVRFPDVGALTGKRKFDGFLPGLTGPLDKPVVSQTAKVHTIGDLEQVPAGGNRVHAFAVPGHTRGSMAYLVDGGLFVGDALVFGPRWYLFGKTVKARLLPRWFAYDNRQAAESLATLVQYFAAEEISPKLVAPNHSLCGEFAAVAEAFG